MPEWLLWLDDDSEILAARERWRVIVTTQADLGLLDPTNAPLITRLVLAQTRRNIPFVKFGGLKFLDAAHIKDMLALLRFVENPRDRVAGFRLLQLLPGVGPTSAQRVLDFIMAVADPISEIAECADATSGWQR